MPEARQPLPPAPPYLATHPSVSSFFASPPIRVTGSSNQPQPRELKLTAPRMPALHSRIHMYLILPLIQVNCK